MSASPSLHVLGLATLLGLGGVWISGDKGAWQLCAAFLGAYISGVAGAKKLSFITLFLVLAFVSGPFVVSNPSLAFVFVVLAWSGLALSQDCVRAPLFYSSLVVPLSFLFFLVAWPEVIRTFSWHKVAEHAPPYWFEDFQGQPVTLEDDSNKIVVLDFWAEWCGSCLAVFPELERLHRSFKRDPRVKVRGVRVHEPGFGSDPFYFKAHALAVKKNYQLSLPLVFDRGDFTSKFNIEGIPAIVIIDGKGIIRYRHHGFVPGEDIAGDVANKIRQLAAE